MLRYISIGGGSYIPMYNFCIGVGVALSMLFLQYYPPFKAKTEQEKYKIHLALVISIVLGFLGAYLFDAYSHHLTLTNDHFTRIGFTFLGGLLSGLGILLFILRIYSIPILPTLNLLTIPFCIAHALGRVGCFMAGCCFGRPTDSVLGVVFPKSSLPYEYYHGLVKIHPTQLYESGFVLLLGLFLTRYTKHKFYLYMLGWVGKSARLAEV